MFSQILVAEVLRFFTLKAFASPQMGVAPALNTGRQWMSVRGFLRRYSPYCSRSASARFSASSVNLQSSLTRQFFRVFFALQIVRSGPSARGHQRETRRFDSLTTFHRCCDGIVENGKEKRIVLCVVAQSQKGGGGTVQVFF